MKLQKASIRVHGSNGVIEIVRSELNSIYILMILKAKIQNLKDSIIATQKGERLIYIQKTKVNRRNNNIENIPKLEYYLYHNTVEHSIVELNRIIEVYLHQFLANIDEDFQIDLLNSSNFSKLKNRFIEKEIYISKINHYDTVIEIRKICNDLKHSYIKEYALSKTLKLDSFRLFSCKSWVL